jgi:hypothetical protein
LAARFGAIAVDLEDLTGQLVADLPDCSAGGELQHNRLDRRCLVTGENAGVVDDRDRLLQIQFASFQRGQRVRQPFHHRHRVADPTCGGQRSQAQLRRDLVGGVVRTRVRVRSQRGEPRQQTDLAGVQPGTFPRHHPQLGEQFGRRQRLHRRS